MAAAWAVAQPLMGVFVGGPSGADYLGGNCLHWLGLIVTGFVCDVDGVSFDYVDIEIPLILLELHLALGFLPTTLALQCADFVAIGNR